MLTKYQKEELNLFNLLTFVFSGTAKVEVPMSPYVSLSVWIVELWLLNHKV